MDVKTSAHWISVLPLAMSVIALIFTPEERDGVKWATLFAVYAIWLRLV